MDVHSIWPPAVRTGITWPADGVMYTYEHRGYIRPEKLEHWLVELFGEGRAKCIVSAVLIAFVGNGDPRRCA